MPNKKLSIWLPLLISISMIFGMVIGFKMRDSFPVDPFFSGRKNNSLNELMKLIQEKYVDQVDIQKISDTAIDAILSQLDPHSSYIPPTEVQDINDEINGQFYGIGIEYEMMDDTLQVLRVLKEGTAYQKGIRKGDQLIRINKINIAGVHISDDSIRNYIRGRRGSELALEIKRDGKTLTLQLKRDYIPVSSIDASYLIAPQIGFIRINKFTTNTHREFMLALTKLQKNGMKKLILDLRDNGGGLLDEAVEIADEFLSGDKLITYTEGKHSPKKEYRCKRPGEFENGTLLVLCNENTASASEILMGALQDWDRATIIGHHSFGKGLVQEQYDLSNQGAIRLTIARYYTPTGRCIQRPYQNGVKAYYENAYLSEKAYDSIDQHAPVFKTPGGKKVYGGGGIRPDFYINDSLENEFQYLMKEYDKISFNRFAHHLIIEDTNFSKKYKDPKTFIEQYEFSENSWEQFLALCFHDLPNPPTTEEKIKKHIILRIKETIAYQIWHHQGYFEIDNHYNPYVQKALLISNQ